MVISVNLIKKTFKINQKTCKCTIIMMFGSKKAILWDHSILFNKYK